MPKIKVENVEISVIKAGGEDYISLTDMVREVENGRRQNAKQKGGGK